MGARLYNTAAGHFTSIDPVYGGNDTPYAYPNDPINKQDTTGEKWSKANWATLGKWASRVSFIASWFPGAGAVVGALAGGISAYSYHRAGDYASRDAAILSTAAGLVMGGAGKIATRAVRSMKVAKGIKPMHAGGKAMRKSGVAPRHAMTTTTRRGRTKFVTAPKPRVSRAERAVDWGYTWVGAGVSYRAGSSKSQSTAYR